MEHIIHIDQAGFNLIHGLEGCVLKPYLDVAGVPTIGWGTTRYPSGVKVKMSDSAITRQQADEYAKHDILYFESKVDAFTRDDINQHQFNALVSLMYNIGETEFRTSTVLKRVNANPNDPTIREAFSRFKYAGGKIDKGLVNRRQKEADHYFSV